MRYELFEGIVIGGIIGFGVMLVRALTVDAPQSQTLLLAVVATVLCLVQIGLTVRRIRRTPTNDPMRNEQHTLPSRRPRTRQDSFAQEEDHRWTGLAVEDELTQSLQEQQSQTPQAQHLADEGETVTETPANGASLTPSNKNNAGDPPPKNGVSAPCSTSAHSVTPRNPVPTPVEDDE